jgi:hypothetical protein
MLHKLLAKKPEQRFQTAAELMAVLDTVAGTLAAKGVLGDFGLRGPGGRGAGGILQRLMRHLPRSSVGRLTGLHVAIAVVVFFASTITVLVLILRGSPDRGEIERAAPDRGMPDRGAPDRGATDRVTTDPPPAPVASTPSTGPTAAPPTRVAPARAPATPSRSAPKAAGSRK